MLPIDPPLRQLGSGRGTPVTAKKGRRLPEPGQGKALATVMASRCHAGNVGSVNPWELEGAEGTVGKGVSRSLEAHANIAKCSELKTLGAP